MARPPPPPGGPPVSFKTVPGRHRTQKWNTARTYDYSGGDWGGYDPYDDYGDEPMEQAPPMPAPSQGGLPSQQQGYGYARPGRQQSFDDGDERRAFSGPGAYPPRGPPGTSPARSAASGGRPSADYPRPSTAGRSARDFTNPEQVPPPLNPAMRSSPAPGQIGAGGVGYMPPPRKSSVSSSTQPAIDLGPPLPMPTAASKDDKELPTIPFIRPSDIYKRMEAEKEKERKSSMDSTSRPSLSDLDASRSPSQQRPLSSVEETGELGSNTNGPLGVPSEFADRSTSSASPSLPPLKSGDSWGQDIFRGSSAGATAGSDPAAEIAAERTHDVPVSDVGQPGTLPHMDPAAAILAERTHDVPVSDVSQPGTLPHTDPAASILAERTHDVPVSAVGREPPDSLSHQPSSGYRSMVHQAFDNSTASRSAPTAGALPQTDVSRSNTNSTSNTSGISPIIGPRSSFEPPVGTIPEEVPRKSTESGRITRKPSPSSAAGIVQPGYRRSLDPPDHDNSPARTPDIDDANRGRSLSGGFSAETVDDALANQGQPSTGRPRAGTDYSVRESDLAREVDSSPDKAVFDQPELAQREKAVQDEYLQSHSPTPPLPSTAAFSSPSPTRSTSPSKSRVRQLADQYQDAERRNSQTSIGGVSNKSSWSNFRGSDENLPGTLAGGQIPQRHATDASNVVSESDYGGVEEGGIRPSPSEEQRPTFDREQSFRPQLPGQWVSTSNILADAAAASSGDREAPAASEPGKTPRTSRDMPTDEGPIDLTPTTRKFQLSTSSQADSPAARFDQTKTAGSALGAALLASVGQGHQTRDFGSTATPAKEVEIPSAYKTRGDLGYMQRPDFERGVTDASMASTLTAASEETMSAAPSPSKDEDLPSANSEGGASFFAGAAVAPLSMGRDSIPALAPEGTRGTTEMYDGSGYGYDSLRRDDSTLRREIVRSLDGDSSPAAASAAAAATEKHNDDTARTQDALDAPENLRQVVAGGSASPPKESEKPLPYRPMMLDQRFSWEANSSPGGGSLLGGPTKPPVAVDPLPAPVPKVMEPESPEIKPEMPYERPRSRGLHIVNADGGDDDISVKEREAEGTDGGLSTGALAVGGAATLGVAAAVGAATVAHHDKDDEGPPQSQDRSGFVSPITKSQENLGSMASIASPSPPAHEDEQRSYLRDAGGLEVQEPMALEDHSHSDAPAPGTVSTTTPDLTLKYPSGPPAPPDKESTASPISPSTNTKPTKIPPFREILALKTPAARIETYNTTRQTFAEMHTGLSDWVAQLLEQNPEYAPLASGAPPLQTSTSFKPGHKASPSLAKFAPKQFGFGGGDVQRSQSVSVGGGSGGGAGGDGEGMDKLQQRGKDLMKGAGVLGGKAQAGAKGLFAKGRSRFGTQREGKSGGSGKAPPPTPDYSSSSSTLFPTARAVSTATPPVPQSSTASSSHDVSTKTASNPPQIPASPSTVPPPDATANPVIIAPPPPRSQTQTPSSIVTTSNPPSRPLSRTFSRLRDRSRSLSSSLSRSKSRPASLILTTSNTNSGTRPQTPVNTNPATSTTGGLGTVLDASPHNLALSRYEVDRGEAGRGVISPWSEPGDPIGGPDGVPGGDTEALDFSELEVMRVGTPGRLGVLPSPTGESFDDGSFVRDGGAVVSGVKDEAGDRDGVDDGGLGRSELYEVGDTAENMREVANVSSAPVSRGVVGNEIGRDELESRGVHDGADLTSRGDKSDADALLSRSRQHEENDLEATPKQADFVAWQQATPKNHEETGAEFDEGRDLAQSDVPTAPVQTGSDARDLEASEVNHDGPAIQEQPVVPGSWTDAVYGEGDLHRDPPPQDTRIIVDRGVEMEEGQTERMPEEDHLEKTSEIVETSPSNRQAQAASSDSPDDDDDELYNTTPVAVRQRGILDVDDGAQSHESESQQASVGAAQMPSGDEIDNLATPTEATITTPTSARMDKELPPLPRDVDEGSIAQPPAVAGAHATDTRSEISSNNDFQDARDDAQDVATDDIQSRRSSVSSLGRNEEPAVMSSHAVPAGPFMDPSTPTANRTHPLQEDDREMQMRQQAFMDRLYTPARPELERPKSYTELGTDATGLPLQETLDTKQASSTNLAASPGDRRSMGRSSGQPILPVLDTTPKRMAAVTKGRRPTLTSPNAEPSASQITDQYGLEDISRHAANVDVGERDSVYRESESTERENKRRSGLWNVMKRSSSRSKSRNRGENATERRDSQQPLKSERGSRIVSQPIPSSQPVASNERGSRAVSQPLRSLPPGSSNERDSRTIHQPVREQQPAKPPQRASTTAAEPEGKKKRFSGLGSLFNRSSTTTGRKLEKSIKGRGRPGSGVSVPPEPSTAGGYDMQEARRRQQFPNLQARSPETFSAVQQPVPPPPSTQSVVYTGPIQSVPISDYGQWRDPPPGGWYAPQSEDYRPPPQLRASQLPPARDRTLHSDRIRTSSVPMNYSGMQFPNTQIPRDQYVPIENQTWDPQRSKYSQTPSSNFQNRRHSSYVSDNYPLSPQVSGQSEWEEESRWRQRGSSFASISPVETRSDTDGLPPQRNFRVGSITEEMERFMPGTAMTSDTQQKPWAISLPQNGRQRREQVPADQSYGQVSPPEDYVWEQQTAAGGEDTRPMSYQPRGMPGVSPGWRGPGSRRPPPREIRADGDRGNSRYYPSPPYAPDSRNSRPYETSVAQTQWQQAHGDYQAQNQGVPSQQITKTSYEESTAFPLPPPTHRRTSSGYTGRRDDPTVREDAVVMRGASYPGQEWSPQWD